MWPTQSNERLPLPLPTAAPAHAAQIERSGTLSNRSAARAIKASGQRRLSCAFALAFGIVVAACLPCCCHAQPDGRFASTTPLTRPDGHPAQLNRTQDASNINSDSIFMSFARHFSTGNELWDGLIRDCYQRPSVACFQRNVYAYLSESLEARDLNVTQHIRLYRNQVECAQPATTEVPEVGASIESETEDEDEFEGEHLLNNEIPHAARADGSRPPIEEVTSALYDKSVRFALTHDMEVQLPEVMFDGATFRISPRSIEGNGIVAKLELIPKQAVEARLAGKILMKKIQKFLKSKVLMSLIALLLIIKIIKIKIFWLLPLIIGVGAAKKLLLKFLLFLFPALSHLFKLCSYYQQTYHHSTKYHHHHHLIDHHHTIVPAWHSGEHGAVPLIYTQPPKGHISAYLHGAPIHETYGPPPPHQHYEQGWENSGPGLGPEYLSDVNRAAQVDEEASLFKPESGDANLLHAWGLGTTRTPPGSTAQAHTHTQAQAHTPPGMRAPATQQQRPPALHKHTKLQLQPQQQQQQQQHLQSFLKPHTHANTHSHSHSLNPFLGAEKQSIFSTSTKHQAQVGQQSAPSPVYTPQRAPPKPAAAQIAAQYAPARTPAHQQQHQQQQQQPLPQQLSPEVAAQLKEALRIQAEHRIIAQQQKILENQPFVQDGQPIMPKNYDPFYTPILQKIDKIIEQLGIGDDVCKERLVCSMYKDPVRYSPHSNFVSAELSRDTSELEPVTKANEAVVRFYRLIQAARDGQEQKDCLRLYPSCSINTE